MASQGFEERVRTAYFVAIRQRQAVHGEVLPREVIAEPIVVDGESITTFSSQRGIHKPRQLDVALAVITTPPKAGADAPYLDQFGAGGMFRYHYRDPSSTSHRARSQAEADNEAVRQALRRSLPLIYWYGVVPGRYRPFYPAYVVGVHPAAREFSLDLTELGARHLDDLAADEPSRAYRAEVVRARMHQARFREGVMRIAIRDDILAEIDGPMLIHGLQGFHGEPLGVLPRKRHDRPSTEFLERRWEEFRATG